LDLRFEVNHSVLIPRPETEELVSLIRSEFANQAPQILDIGTGSGCIAISLQKLLPQATVFAIDISAKALLVAESNAKLNNASVSFIETDILNPNKALIPNSLDVIVSNPPYVTESEKAFMEKNVLDYEPHNALFVPDNDALIFYREIAQLATDKLKKGGKIYFEINEAKSDEVVALLEKLGFIEILVVKDIHGKNRIIRARI